MWLIIRENMETSHVHAVDLPDLIRQYPDTIYCKQIT